MSVGEGPIAGKDLIKELKKHGYGPLGLGVIMGKNHYPAVACSSSCKSGHFCFFSNYCSLFCFKRRFFSFFFHRNFLDGIPTALKVVGKIYGYI